MTKQELENVPVEDLQRVYRDFSRQTVYNYEDHVKLAKHLDVNGKLPAIFMVVGNGSWQEDVWDDINRMKTLNSEQVRRNVMMHVCPLQTDIIERIINRYSNKGDVVFDPFGGIGSVPMMAIKMGRKGYMTELNSDYFRDAIGYLKSAEQQADMPTLFDIMGI
jgi:hypothetical protein